MRFRDSFPHAIALQIASDSSKWTPLRRRSPPVFPGPSPAAKARWRLRERCLELPCGSRQSARNKCAPWRSLAIPLTPAPNSRALRPWTDPCPPAVACGPPARVPGTCAAAGFFDLSSSTPEAKEHDRRLGVPFADNFQIDRRRSLVIGLAWKLEVPEIMTHTDPMSTSKKGDTEIVLLRIACRESPRPVRSRECRGGITHRLHSRPATP